MTLNARLVLLVLAVLTFLLVVFEAHVGDLSELRLVALGLAFFAGAHIP